MAVIPNDISRVCTSIGNDSQNSATFTVDAKSAARQLARETFYLETASVLANGSNAVAANAAPAIYMPRAGRVLELTFLPHGTATENASTYAQGKLNKVFGNGTVGAAAASFTTQPIANGGGGNVALATTYPPSTVKTVTTTEEDFPAGCWLSPNVQQVSSGVAFPAGSWTWTVEWQGVDRVPV